MDQTTKKLITMHKALHPIADVDRLYVSRKEGGKGRTTIQDCECTSIKRRGLHYKEQKRLIPAASKSIGKIRQGRKKSKKLGNKKTHIYGVFKRITDELHTRKPGYGYERKTFNKKTKYLLIEPEKNAISINYNKPDIGIKVRVFTNGPVIGPSHTKDSKNGTRCVLV